MGVGALEASRNPGGSGRDGSARDARALIVAKIPASEIAVRQVRHRVVDLAVRRAADVEDADDVRMIEPRDRARLVLEALDEILAVRVIGREHLDRDRPAERALDAEIDGRHAAEPEPADDAITLDLERELQLAQLVTARSSPNPDSSQACVDKTVNSAVPDVENAGSDTVCGTLGSA